MEVVAQVVIGGGLLVFMLSVAYSSGRLSNRVEALEAWRGELRDDLAAIRSSLETIKSGIFTGRP